MKMPEPIIEPITIAVAENSPIPCTKCGDELSATLTCEDGAEESVECAPAGSEAGEFT
jgi:hypothetical protein